MGLYTTTGTDHHARVTQEMFLKQLEQGFIDKRTSEQFFDPEADRFLPDRYIEGTCPHCGYGEARGDQCDNCGRTLDATDLIDPAQRSPVPPRAAAHRALLLPVLRLHGAGRRVLADKQDGATTSSTS